METVLTARDALTIAANYGLPYRAFKAEIRSALLQAREADKARKSARQYFDGYMADLAFECGCDDRAAAAFEDMAYGPRDYD